MSLFAKRTNHWQHEPNALEQARQQNPLLEACLDLTQSNPTQAGFQYPTGWLNDLNDPQALVYDPQSFGLLKARQAVSDYYARRGYAVAIDHIMLTASSSESYGYLLRLLVNPHEKVLIPSPSYPLFPYLLDINDAAYDTYQLLPGKDWAIDREDLISRLDGTVKAVMVVHPNNPTGSYINSDDRLWLVQLARERGIALIVDEVFIDYAHGQEAESFVNQYDCLIFVLGGLSKTLCLPQMKLGWMIPVGPKDLVEGALVRLEIIADTFLSVNTPVQLAASQWLKDVDHIQGQVMARLKANWMYIVGHQHASMTIQQPQAGWYVLVQLPHAIDDEDFCLKLLANGVRVYPGYYFDLPANNYIIVSLLTEQEEFMQGWYKLCQII